MSLERIFHADSESVVCFQIGPWEVPQMFTFSDRKWPFDPLGSCDIWSERIFNADSESVVRFQIGPQEVPQLFTFSDRKWPFDPLGGRYIFFLFFS